MKISKLLAAATLLMGVCFGASAQSENYSHVSLGYNATFVSPKFGDGLTLNGFSAQYDYGFSLGNSMFLELGGALSFGSGSFSGEDISMKLLQISVPVSFGYKLNLTDSFSLMPYTGISFKINALGKMGDYNIFASDESDEDYDDYDYESYDYEPDSEHYGNDDSESDLKYKRFQMGWHLGVRAAYNNWTFGVRYNYDFVKLQKYINTSNLTIAVGYKF